MKYSRIIKENYDVSADVYRWFNNYCNNILDSNDYFKGNKILRGILNDALSDDSILDDLTEECIDEVLYETYDEDDYDLVRDNIKNLIEDAINCIDNGCEYDTSFNKNLSDWVDVRSSNKSYSASLESRVRKLEKIVFENNENKEIPNIEKTKDFIKSILESPLAKKEGINANDLKQKVINNRHIDVELPKGVSLTHNKWRSLISKWMSDNKEYKFSMWKSDPDTKITSIMVYTEKPENKNESTALRLNRRIAYLEKKYLGKRINENVLINNFDCKRIKELISTGVAKEIKRNIKKDLLLKDLLKDVYVDVIDDRAPDGFISIFIAVGNNDNEISNEEGYDVNAKNINEYEVSMLNDFEETFPNIDSTCDFIVKNFIKTNKDLLKQIYNV